MAQVHLFEKVESEWVYGVVHARSQNPTQPERQSGISEDIRDREDVRTTALLGVRRQRLAKLFDESNMMVFQGSSVRCRCRWVPGARLIFTVSF